MKPQKTDFEKRGLLFVLLVAMSASFGFGHIIAFSESSSTAVIELEEFRWTSFPLSVYVDMTSWAMPSYSVAVRDALDDWVKSIWNYTQAYNDTSLPTINYLYYVSNVNSTDRYDVVISFTPDKMPPTSNAVGLTTYSWNAITHVPIAPITINITTFSATATSLFVKNVAMHEFGHALGLGHASSANTLNGPELMYFSSSKNQVVYPSTLDVYGLTNLYHGDFSQNVQLPTATPYVMLAQGEIPPPEAGPSFDYKPYLPFAAVAILLIVVALVLRQVTKEQKDQNIPQPPAPPPIEASSYMFRFLKR